MSMAGSALVGAAIWGRTLYDSWRPRKVGIYGASLVGKTTLDRYMTTPGEMEDIPEEERTRHYKLLSQYILPKPTAKRVKYDNHTRLVHSSDMGGQKEYWNLWIDDMVARQMTVHSREVKKV